MRPDLSVTDRQSARPHTHRIARTTTIESIIIMTKQQDVSISGGISISTTAQWKWHCTLHQDPIAAAAVLRVVLVVIQNSFSIVINALSPFNYCHHQLSSSLSPSIDAIAI